MKTDLRLLLDDIINKVINFNEKESRQLQLKLGYGRVKITTHDDHLGCSACLIDKEKLEAAKKWIDAKISARHKEFLTKRYGLNRHED